MQRKIGCKLIFKQLDKQKQTGNGKMVSSFEKSPRLLPALQFTMVRRKTEEVNPKDFLGLGELQKCKKIKTLREKKQLRTIEDKD